MTTCIYPPIQLDPNKRHEIALIRLETYNSIPNVDDTCNIFRYWVGSDRHDITLPTGAYELSDINDVIQKQLVEPDLFEVDVNTKTLKAVIRINDDRVRIVFKHDGSMRSLLGFTADDVEGVGEHEGVNIVNILKVNSIRVHCDLVTGSYVNQSQRPVIYSFFPNVPPGYKVVEIPGTPVYLPVTQRTIESFKVWLTDQEEQLIDLRGEVLTMWFHIRTVNESIH